MLLAAEGKLGIDFITHNKDDKITFLSYNITIIENHPECVFLTLSTDNLPFAFLNHLLFDIVGYSHNIRSRIRIAYYEII